MGKCYLVHLGYDGTQYHGWQKQPDKSTLQQTFYDVLGELFPRGRIKVFAASRTDSGVHSLGQTCKLDLPCRLAAEELKECLNKALPADMTVFDARRIAPSFKITDYVVSKEYLYLFSLDRNIDLPFVATMEEELDLNKMKAAAREFVGEFDFVNFQHRSQVKGDFKRTILDSRIYAGHELFSGLPEDVMVFHVKGSGFLKQMVRLMMGAIFNIGMNKTTISELQESLRGAEIKTGFIAPAKGLILYKIDYPYWQDSDIQPVIDAQLWRNFSLPHGFFPHRQLK